MCKPIDKQERKREPIQTTLTWHRTEEEKPPLDKWLIGVFIWSDRNFIGDCIFCVDLLGVPCWLYDGKCYSDNNHTPVLWTDPNEIIRDLVINHGIDPTIKFSEKIKANA